jgi:hypothetical protein
MWATLGQFFSQYAPPLTAGGAALSALAAAAGLMWDARATRRQTNSQIMIEYTRRYMEIVERCPDEWYRRLEDPPPPSDPRLTRALHLYLDLECQEMYLVRTGHFSEKIWTLWKSLFIQTLRSSFFKREWPTLKPEFMYDPDFVQYVEQHAGLAPVAARHGSPGRPSPQHSHLGPSHRI